MGATDWLRHPAALAARRYWTRRQAGESAYTVDDAQQSGAIAAWQQDQRGTPATGALAYLVGRNAVVDELRTVFHDPRYGATRPDLCQLTDESHHRGADQTDITPERILSARQALRRLLSMPAVWQRVALGVLNGDSYEQIGLDLDPPVTASRVCQIVHQIRGWVDHAKEPRRPQLAETADTDARPQPHAVRALHALDAVHARAAIAHAIHDPAIGDIRAAAAVRAAAAAELYRRAFGE